MIGMGMIGFCDMMRYDVCVFGCLTVYIYIIYRYIHTVALSLYIYIYIYCVYICIYVPFVLYKVRIKHA